MLPTSHRPRTATRRPRYRPHTEQLPTTYRPHTEHVTDHRPTTYRPHTEHTTDHVPTTHRACYRPRTDHTPNMLPTTPTTYRLHAENVNDHILTRSAYFTITDWLATYEAKEHVVANPLVGGNVHSNLGAGRRFLVITSDVVAHGKLRQTRCLQTTHKHSHGPNIATKALLIFLQWNYRVIITILLCSAVTWDIFPSGEGDWGEVDGWGGNWGEKSRGTSHFSQMLTGFVTRATFAAETRMFLSGLCVPRFVTDGQHRRTHCSSRHNVSSFCRGPTCNAMLSSTLQDITGKIFLCNMTST